MNKNKVTEVFFRAKAIKDNDVYRKDQWVQGGYYKHPCITPSPVGDTVTEEDYKYFILTKGFSDWNLPEMKAVEIDKDTLCMFTGIRTKTKAPVFDKDVIEVKYFGLGTWNTVKYLIQFDGNKFYQVDGDSGLSFPLEIDSKDFKILGNIVDNPKLIKIKSRG